MDEAARVTGLSPAEIRRRNFIRPEQMPYKTRDRQHLRHGRVRRAHGPVAGARGGRQLRGAARREPGEGPHPRPRLQHLHRDLRLQGLGAGQGRAGGGRHRQPPYRHAVDGAGAPDRLCAVRGRAARPRLRPDPRRAGRLRRAADAAAAPAARAPSRSARRRSTARRGCSPSRSRRIAADELEAGVGDIELVDGTARVVGTDRASPMPMSRSGRRTRPSSSRSASSRPEEQTYPNGTHVCEVEIDPETGRTEVVALHDRRRFRRDGEPDAARRPGAWRRGAVDRPGAARAHRLRRRRPAHHRDLQRLRHAARRRLSLLRLPDAQRARANGTRLASRAPARPARSARRRR